MYRHTQRALGAPLIIAGISLALLPTAWEAPLPIRVLLLGVLALLVWLGWSFRQMTVEVAGGELRAWFGDGWPRYHWPLERIESVRTVHNQWWYGTGIRFAPSGMLYNVAPGPGIEFRLRSGATFRLGSDDAQGLTAALRSAAALETPNPERTTAVPPGRTESTAH